MKITIQSTEDGYVVTGKAWTDTGIVEWCEESKALEVSLNRVEDWLHLMEKMETEQSSIQCRVDGTPSQVGDWYYVLPEGKTESFASREEAVAYSGRGEEGLRQVTHESLCIID